MLEALLAKAPELAAFIIVVSIFIRYITLKDAALATMNQSYVAVVGENNKILGQLSEVLRNNTQQSKDNTEQSRHNTEALSAFNQGHQK